MLRHLYFYTYIDRPLTEFREVLAGDPAGLAATAGRADERRMGGRPRRRRHPAELARAATCGGLPRGHVGTRSGGRIFGNLYLTEKPGGFTDVDERVIVVLAAQAGAAIENARLSDRLRELAVREERDRLARELHDGVIQSLFSTGMGLESARGLIEHDPARARARIESAVDAIDGAIRELRNHIFRLRPHQAASLGLEGGLLELAREFEVNALTRPIVDVPPALDARVPERVVPDLLQIVREALANTAKHAGAGAVTVRIALEEDLVLEVVDDGSGFQPDQLSVGRGLENIRDRVRALGGALDIRSAPGEGTTIAVDVPMYPGPAGPPARSP